MMKRNVTHESDALVLTLRNPPRNVARAIRDRARKRRTSLNKAVISLLEESPGVVQEMSAKRHHDLDELAGCWSSREADGFDKALHAQRVIDPELWEP